MLTNFRWITNWGTSKVSIWSRNSIDDDWSNAMTIVPIIN